MMVDFTGQLNSAAFGAKAGDTFTGSITYDSSEPQASHGGNLTTYNYSAANPGDITVSLSVDKKDFSFVTAPTGSQIVVGNDNPTTPVGDSIGFNLQSAISANKGSILNLALDNPGGTAFSSGAIPTSLSLSSFGNVSFSFGVAKFNKDGSFRDSFNNQFVTGTLTSVSAQPVPEPTTAAVFGLGIAACGPGTGGSPPR